MLDEQIKALFKRIRRSYFIRSGLMLLPEEVAWLCDVGVAEQFAKHWVDDDNPKSETTDGVCEEPPQKPVPPDITRLKEGQTKPRSK